MLDFVRERQMGLVVIGPEAPLVKGVADVLREAGVAVPARTPTARSSKARSPTRRSSCWKTAFPTAAYAVFDAEEPALA